MTWFKIDDRSHHNPKVLAAGNEAWGAFCRAGAWASENLTDGLIPEAAAHSIAKRKIWKKLLECELVVESGSGYEIPKFLEYNPCSSEVLEKKAELSKTRAEQGRRGGLQSGETRRSKRSKPEATEEANSKQTGKQTTKQTGSPDPDPDPGFGSSNQIPERERALVHARGPQGQDGDSRAPAAPPTPVRSDSGQRDDSPPERPVTGQPDAKSEIESLPLAEAVATLPDWATALVGTAEMTSGYRGDPKADWAMFVSHIFACRQSSGPMRRVDNAEWLKWLSRAARQPQGARTQSAPKTVARETRLLPPEERPTKPTSGSLLDYIKEPAPEPTEGDS